MERPPQMQPESQRAERWPLHVEVRRGLKSVDPEHNPPYNQVVRYLAALAPADVGAHDAQQQEAAATCRRRLRFYGLTDAQIEGLTAAANADVAEHRTEEDSHRLQELTRLHREEVRDVEALISFGGVTTQARADAHAVVGYIMDHHLAEQAPQEFRIGFSGPLSALLDATQRYGDAIGAASRNVGVFHPVGRSVNVCLTEGALESGELQDYDRTTLIHELVHAASPSGYNHQAEPDGTITYTRLRTGFSSQAGRSSRRSEEPVSLGLNEGVTEMMARLIAEREGIRPDSAPVYEGFVRDVETLIGILDIPPDELFRLYHDPAGTLKLGRLIRERTRLGPHGLALFDIFSRSAEGGFTAFNTSLEAYQAQLPQLIPQPVEVPVAIVEKPVVGGKHHPIYPPLTAQMLEESFPFVRVSGKLDA